MRRYIYTGLMSALLLGWGCIMACCASSDDSDDRNDGQTLRIGSVTRTGEEEPESLDPNPLPWGDITLFMCPNDGTYPVSQDQSGTISYNGLDDGGDIIWNTSPLVVKPGRDYYIFGYMPAGIGSNNSVTVNSATTATMTFSNLPTMTDQDICVIVGVKEGKTQLGISDQGSFAYHAPENTSDGYYVSLLADHLYASVEFRVTIADDYNVLRKVVLKKMTLKCLNAGKTLMDTEVTLTMNDQSTHPIASDPVPTMKTGGAEAYVLYTSDEGVELSTTEYQSFTSSFAEGVGADLALECEYDLYDRVSGDNSKIETRTVVNGLSSLLKNQKRGRNKVINLMVDPTYLYQLSDGDVDK